MRIPVVIGIGSIQQKGSFNELDEADYYIDNIESNLSRNINNNSDGGVNYRKNRFFP